jgi:cell division protein FtsI (penicillin-binding protein 3)
MNIGARALVARQAGLFDAAARLPGTAARVGASMGASVGASVREAAEPFFPGARTSHDAARRPEARRLPVAETLQQQRARMLNAARQRVLLLALAFAALALVALVQVAWLGMAGAGGSNRGGTDPKLPPRAVITDRNGVVLAGAYPAYSLYFYPQAMDPDGENPLVRSPQEIARALKAIFPEASEEAFARKLAAGEGGYLLRRILPEQANQVWGLGEIAIQSPTFLDRHYPQGKLAAHVIGRVADKGEEQVGRFGIEQSQEGRLSDPAKRGTPLELALDVRVQGALEDEMGTGMKLAQADGAAGIVLDVDTGEVIALASLPDFNPNRISGEDADNTSNRVTYVTGELGSVFKPLTVAAALDAGVVTDLSASWNATPVTVGGRDFADHEDKGDRLTIPEALAYSSNTVTMRVAQELGGERLRQVWLDLGMDRAPKIELQARGEPYFPKGKWSPMTTMTAAYGHGFNVTPLHLANAYAAMVNGGIYRDATLLKVAPGEAAAGRRVFKASTSQKMRQLLRLIAIYGTGRQANATGFRVGGKTGSAEKLVDGRYSKTRIISTFAAAFPMDDPRYVVVVSLDEPKITHAMAGRTAYFNAAPIVGNVIRRAAPMLGIRPDNTREVDVTDLDYLLRKDQ